jgi:hypothetical protein
MGTAATGWGEITDRRSSKLDDDAADSRYDEYKRKVASCLGSNWKKTKHTTSSGNSYGRFENDAEKSYIEVEKHARLRGSFTVDVDVAVSP